jgi:hypothetical protein
LFNKVSTVFCAHVEELAEQIVQLQPELAAHDSQALPANVATLIGWLDDRFLQMAIDAGARQIKVEDTIEECVLERAGYFESFAIDRLVQSSEGKLYPPAACYQCYPSLSQVEHAERGLWTCIAACGRKEEETGLGRLRNFHMREIVLVGSSNWVREERGRWMDKISEFARALGLRGELHSASDPFFGAGETRGRKLVQQLMELKFEMQVRIGRPVPGLAIASFNLHERFFAERFGLHLPGGADACTGCVAFGLERWALALVAELGPSRAFNLAEGILA